MSRYSKEMKQVHIERVRAVMIVRPSASTTEIRDVLARSRSSPLDLSIDYICDLKKKIAGERIHRMRNLNAHARVAEIQDKAKLISERLWEESSNQASPAVARIAALGKIIDIEMKMLEIEMDAGVIDRNLGTLNVNHHRRLSTEQARVIADTMRLWGIVREPDENEESPDVPALPDHEPGSNT